MERGSTNIIPDRELFSKDEKSRIKKNLAKKFKVDIGNPKNEATDDFLDDD